MFCRACHPVETQLCALYTKGLGHFSSWCLLAHHWGSKLYQVSQEGNHAWGSLPGAFSLDLQISSSEPFILVSASHDILSPTFKLLTTATVINKSSCWHDTCLHIHHMTEGITFSRKREDARSHMSPYPSLGDIHLFCSLANSSFYIL